MIISTRGIPSNSLQACSPLTHASAVDEESKIIQSLVQKCFTADTCSPQMWACLLGKFANKWTLASSIQCFILTACFLFSSFSQMKSLKTLQIFGLLNTEGIEVLRAEIPNINVNKSFFSMIARPVGSEYYGKIWGIQCKG